MNILLIGGEAAGTETLRMLAATQHRIVGVLAAEENRSPMRHLWAVASRAGYRLWPAKLVKDAAFAEQLQAKSVDVVLNVHSLYIIHDRVLAAARVGCFNLHPAPLPRYAGLNSVNWAIYRGETSHGVTLHKMVPQIDAGPIVYQSVFSIAETESALSVAARCAKKRLALIQRLLQVLSEGAAAPEQPQDLSRREYFGKEVPENGCVRWSCPAREIVNFVRACDFHPFSSRWGHPKAQAADGRTVELLKASLTGERTAEPPGTVGDSDGTSVRVACGDEWISVHKLLTGMRWRHASDLLRPGHRLQDGLSVKPAMPAA